LGDRSRRFVSMSAARWPASIKIECGVGVAHVSRVKCVVKRFVWVTVLCPAFKVKTNGKVSFGQSALF
jgi:hypothetical protein